jgi:DNA-dependent RNA polymerase auxiliary subunit epsilon
MPSIEQQIINKIGFDPDNKQDCLNAVKQNRNSIQYIHNPSEKVQLEAVKQNGYNIVYIQNPSEKLKLEAVKQNGYNIVYIQNPSIELQKLAIHNSGYNIKIIALCPDWKEFRKEIEDNMMIKDIIE